MTALANALALVSLVLVLVLTVRWTWALVHSVREEKKQAQTRKRGRA